MRKGFEYDLGQSMGSEGGVAMRQIEEVERRKREVTGARKKKKF